MNKIYILDTSVFISDPYAIDSFENSEVVLPITILEELDKLKKMSGDTGRNARLAIRQLDEISNLGDITTGILLNNSIFCRIATNEFSNIGQDSSYGDSRILGCAVGIKNNSDKDVILVSKDINLRVRAKAFNLLSEDYNKVSDATLELYKGYKEVVSVALGNKLQTNNFIELHEFERKTDHFLNENEFVLINNSKGEGVSIGRRCGSRIQLIKPINPWGLAPRNKEQSFLIDLLMDTGIPLVSIIGKAGVGKTLLALACCLELVLEKRIYSKLIICRPIQTIGAELGYLPGTISEKIEPYYNAISDAFAHLLQGKFRNKNNAWKEQFYQYVDAGIIQQEPVTYMRGRSISNALILIDEAQNLSKEEIKAILTRAGDNSKIIISGDIEQIDSNNLDAMNNGLTYVIDKFKSSHIAGHITLVKGERSELATISSQIL